MGNAQTACPNCGRRHSPYVAYYIARGWNELQRGAHDQARQAFYEAMRVTPTRDKLHLRSYINYLSQMADRTRAAAHPAGVVAPKRVPLARPSPTNARALFLHFNEKPMNIVRVMDDARRQAMEFAQARRKRMWLLALLFPAGVPFICLDTWMGYNICTFSLIALVLWGAAIVGFFLLSRDRSSAQPFNPHFDDARTIFETLKDDLSPKRTLIGWLDLTGPQQPGKVVREATSSSGMPIKFYRDEWLRMKMMLYDGNVMRVSCLERVKARMGRWKRGRSGKMKWKSGTSAAQNELRVALTINKEAYAVLPFQQPVQVGKFYVNVKQADDGRIVLDADAETEITAADILQLLRFTYAHLEPRGASAIAGG